MQLQRCQLAEPTFILCCRDALYDICRCAALALEACAPYFVILHECLPPPGL
jgi:hypothetical protein